MNLETRCRDPLTAKVVQAWNSLPRLSATGPAFVLMPEITGNGASYLHRSLRILSLEQASRRANDYWSCTRSEEYQPGSRNKPLIELHERLGIPIALPFFYAHFPASADSATAQEPIAAVAKAIDRCRLTIWTRKSLEEAERARDVGRRIGELLGNSAFDSALGVAADHHLVSKATYEAYEKFSDVSEIAGGALEVVERAGSEADAKTDVGVRAAALAQECVKFLKEITPVAAKPRCIEISRDATLLSEDGRIPLLVGINGLETQGPECRQFLRELVKKYSGRRSPILVLVTSASREAAYRYARGELRNMARTTSPVEEHLLDLWTEPERSAPEPDVRQAAARADQFFKVFSGLMASHDQQIVKERAPALFEDAMGIRADLLCAGAGGQLGADAHAKTREHLLASFLLACAIVTLLPYIAMLVSERVQILESLEPDIFPHLDNNPALDSPSLLVEMGIGSETARLELLCDVYADVYDFEGLRRLFEDGGRFSRLAAASQRAGCELHCLWLLVERYLYHVSMLRPAAAKSAALRFESLGRRVAERDPLLAEAIRLKQRFCDGLAAYHLGRIDAAAEHFAEVSRGYERAPRKGMPEGDEPDGARHRLAKKWAERCERRLARDRADLEGASPIGEAWRIMKALWTGQ